MQDALVYKIKTLQTPTKKVVRIILQNENGPCPLLAISNILILTGELHLHEDYAWISSQQLLDFLKDYLEKKKPPKAIAGDPTLLANYKQNLADVIKMLPRLEVGLDVNVRFRRINDFEFTQECLIFDLLNINLYHGWLFDPQDEEAAQAIGGQSYNQLQDRVVAMHALQNRLDEGEKMDREEVESVLGVGKKIEAWLNSTASQLTYHGLLKLHEGVRDKELCVFFRNNHFSTMFSRKGELYLLVTDLGYATKPLLVWEKLDNVEGDAAFFTADFQPFKASGAAPDDVRPPDHAKEKPAQGGDDYELAWKLQQQELKKEQQKRGGGGQQRPPKGEKYKDDEDECVLF